VRRRVRGWVGLGSDAFDVNRQVRVKDRRRRGQAADAVRQGGRPFRNRGSEHVNVAVVRVEVLTGDNNADVAGVRWVDGQVNRAGRVGGVRHVDVVSIEAQTSAPCTGMESEFTVTCICGARGNSGRVVQRSGFFGVLVQMPRSGSPLQIESAVVAGVRELDVGLVLGVERGLAELVNAVVEQASKEAQRHRAAHGSGRFLRVGCCRKMRLRHAGWS